MENDSNKASSNGFLSKIEPTLVAWLTFLTLGGGILLLYYARLRYLPEVEWDKSLVYLALATLIGGTVALLLGLSLFVPGYIWSEFLICDERLKNAFCFHPDTNETCLQTLAKNIGLPFWFVLLGSHLTLLVVPLFMSATTLQDKTLLWIYAGVSFVLLLVVSRCMKVMFRRLLHIARKAEIEKSKNPERSGQAGNCSTQEKERRKQEDQRRVFKYIAWFGLSVLVGQISMILIYLLSGRQTGLPFLITTIACGLGVLISNHFVAIHYRTSHVQSIIAALVITVLILFFTERNEKLSLKIGSFFGVGYESQKVNLLLDDEGRRIICELKLPNTCTDPKDSSDNKISGVYILSRLGNEYYLDYQGKTFTLPKSAVRSRTAAQ